MIKLHASRFDSGDWLESKTSRPAPPPLRPFDAEGGLRRSALSVCLPPLRTKIFLGPCKAPKGTNTKVASAKGHHFRAYPIQDLPARPPPGGLSTPKAASCRAPGRGGQRRHTLQ